MAYREELEVISALCKNKDIHVLFENNADVLIRDCSDVWDYVKDYYQMTKQIPSGDMLQDRFRDFDIVDAGPTAYQIDKLRQAYLDEELRSAVRQAANFLQNNESDKALSALIANISDMSKVRTGVKDIDVTDIDSVMSHFDQVRETAANGITGIRSGITSFDVCLPMGISKGQLGILLAYPAIGKSWLALYFAVQAWKSGKVPMILSLEMTETEVRNRILTIAGDGEFSHRSISGGRVDNESFKKWADVNLAERPPFKIVSSGNGSDVNPNLIRAKIDQYRPDIVFIDYLQLMTDNNASTSNETVKIKNLSRELKLLAISENIPIVAIASATPEDSSDLESVPQLGQVAWSRQIAYDADWVLAMGRKQNSDILECAFRKNRNGYLGDFIVQVDFDRGKFTEIDESFM